MLVNVWTTLVLNLSLRKSIYPRGILTSQYCEYFFSTLGSHAENQTSSLLATKIDGIMGRGILTRMYDMKLGKNFSYLHAKAPIYLKVYFFFNISVSQILEMIFHQQQNKSNLRTFQLL